MAQGSQRDPADGSANPLNAEVRRPAQRIGRRVNGRGRLREELLEAYLRADESTIPLSPVPQNHHGDPESHSLFSARTLGPSGESEELGAREAYARYRFSLWPEI